MITLYWMFISGFLGIGIPGSNADQERWSSDLCRDGPGVRPLPGDCEALVICAGAQGNATAVRVASCPPGSAFSASNATCLPAEQVAGCEWLASSDAVRRRRRQSSAVEVEVEGRGRCDSGRVGPLCDGCDLLVVCAELAGQMTPIASVSCSAGTMCSEEKESCVPETDQQRCSATRSAKFQCLAAGLYPDPFDCRRYHLCGADLGHISDSCDAQFDAVNGSCLEDKPSDDKCSPLSQPLDCATDARPRAFVQSPSFYSLCVPQSDGGFHVSVVSCPDGQSFDEASSTCRPSCGGRLGRLAVAGDCRSFVECSPESPEPRKRSCGAGLAFHAQRHMCLPEDQVPSCQTGKKGSGSSSRQRRSQAEASSQTSEEPATNTSTAEQPVTSPSIVSSSSPVDVNSPASSQAPSTISDPLCYAAGISDPNACRRYRRCRSSWFGRIAAALRWCSPYTRFGG